MRNPGRGMSSVNWHESVNACTQASELVPGSVSHFAAAGAAIFQVQNSTEDSKQMACRKGHAKVCRSDLVAQTEDGRRCQVWLILSHVIERVRIKGNSLRVSDTRRDLREASRSREWQVCRKSLLRFRPPARQHQAELAVRLANHRARPRSRGRRRSVDRTRAS